MMIPLVPVQEGPVDVIRRCVVVVDRVPLRVPFSLNWRVLWDPQKRNPSVVQDLRGRESVLDDFLGQSGLVESLGLVRRV